MVLTDEQLQRIWRAKQPRGRTESIGGSLAEGLSKRHDGEVGKLIVQIRSAMEEVVDDMFREHSRLITFDRGTVTIAIDDPALVYSFRMKYVFPLREQLRSALPSARVNDVRFRALY